MKYKKEKKKQERLREQRKMQIIAKIIREMNDDVLSRKPKYICSKRYKIKEITSVEETSFEDFRNEELAIVEKDKSMEEQVAEESEKDYRIEDLSLEEYDDKTKPKGNEIILKKIVLKKSIKTSLKQKTFPIDTCFYATPSVVIFEVLDLFFKISRFFDSTSIVSIRISRRKKSIPVKWRSRIKRRNGRTYDSTKYTPKYGSQESSRFLFYKFL